jgi:bifunctional non-homologous end joining protein LigD
MAGKLELPSFIEPMLAKPAQPFDSDHHLFEIKWDGTRTLCFVEGGKYRLLNRRRVDMTPRYPEFGRFAQLPAGCILDGEVVVMNRGKPDFGLLLSREGAGSPLRVRAFAQTTPATYIAFDLLFENFRPLLAQPLTERRQRLLALVQRASISALSFSEGIVGTGAAFFDEACRQGLEGVVAKRLDSSYLPGKRTDAWQKIKRTGELICAIIGFLPQGNDDFRSLVLAAHEDDTIRCVGKVGTGFSAAVREKLNRLLWARLIPRPCIPCKLKGKWVVPGLFCRVKFMERTSGGELRAPVFKELIEG